MFKASGILTLAVGLLMLGSASAQDVPLECQLFGCPDEGGGDTSGDTPTDTGGDTSGEDTSGEDTSGEDTSGEDTSGEDASGEDACELVDAVADSALPDSASAQGVQKSAQGIQTANQARENGRDFGHCQAGK